MLTRVPRAERSDLPFTREVTQRNLDEWQFGAHVKPQRRLVVPSGRGKSPLGPLHNPCAEHPLLLLEFLRDLDQHVLRGEVGIAETIHLFPYSLADLG